jgi:hypothetical protein
MVRLSTRRRRSVARCGLAAVALVCLMSACSGKSASSYPGTRELARALNANGVGCTGFSHATAGGSRGQGGGGGPLKKKGTPLAQESGSCSHGGGRLLLFVFASPALRDRWVKVGRLYGSVVLGPDWSISTQTKAVAEDVRDAIGGEVR